MTVVEREYTGLNAQRPTVRERAAGAVHDTSPDADSVYAGIATTPDAEETSLSEDVARGVTDFKAGMAERLPKLNARIWRGETPTSPTVKMLSLRRW